ncbi:MAG: histidine kinase N-terminal 7TM domain-containing protein [Methanomassiliicoccales archaeon]
MLSILNLISLVYILTAVISILLVSLVWGRRNTPGTQPFIVMMAAVTLLAIGNIMELVNTEVGAKYFWVCVEYIGIVAVPACYLCFALEYTGRKFDQRRVTIILAIMPIIVLLAVWTNDWTHIYYVAQTPTTLGDTIMVERQYAPLFYIWLAYSYFLLVLATILMVKALVNAQEERRRQIELVIVGSLAPWIANIFYFILVPLRYIDLTCVGFTITGVAVFIAFSRYDLFDVAPLARSSVVGSMDDAVVVMDQYNRVVDANLAAAALASRSLGKIIGRNLAEGFSNVPALVKAAVQSSEGVPQEVSEVGRYFEVRSFALKMTSNRPLGKVAVIREVTESKRQELALMEAQERIELLNSVARQDMLNMSMAISGYAALLEEQLTTPRQKEYVAKIKRSARNIESQVKFTKEYLELGGNMPVWQNVPETLQRAAEASDLNDMRLELQITSLEVYADPLINRVLFILMDNVSRHAKGATYISAHFDISYGELKLIIEDDGPGVVREEKEAIFQRNYGKNTGYGLFFARQILQLTGFAIIENGVEGKGARFEISVPQGSYRLHPAGESDAVSARADL